MPAKRKKIHASPAIPPEYEALFECYLKPFLKIADQVDEKASNPEFHILSAFDSVTPYIAYIDIISDVVSDAYLHQLKRIGIEGIIPLMATLAECAKLKAENEPFVLDDGQLIFISNDNFLTSDLVEEIVEELSDDSVFKKRPFLYYYALAIMQLSSLLNEDIKNISDEDKISRYIDIRVCLERARFSLERFYEKQSVSHKDVASKGGRERFSKHYSAAREYTVQRHKQLKATNPSISRRKAALTISDEAAEHPAFKHMSKDNLYETIEKWLKRYSAC